MLSLSDRLAVTRTALANERTLLAYVRTALAMAAGGIGLVEIFTAPALEALGWALLPAAGGVLLAGVARFSQTRRTLHESALDRRTASLTQPPT